MADEKKRRFLPMTERNHRQIKKALSETIAYLVEVNTEFTKPDCEMDTEDELAFANDVAFAASRLKGLVTYIRERHEDREALAEAEAGDDDDDDDSEKWRKGKRPDHLE